MKFIQYMSTCVEMHWRYDLYSTLSINSLNYNYIIILIIIWLLLQSKSFSIFSAWIISFAPLITGTVYYQSYNPLLLMSGFCVYSVASALFMFPALYLYYQKALEVTAYERADGAGRSVDIVIQGFIRGITLGFFPVIICAAVLYLLVGYCHIELKNFYKLFFYSFLACESRILQH